MRQRKYRSAYEKAQRKLKRMKRRLKFMEQFIDWIAYMLTGFILTLLAITFGYGISYWVLYNDSWMWALLWCFICGVALAVHHQITKYIDSRKEKANEHRQDSSNKDNERM